jgi:hypothetical protein|tara:strand:- start:1056 stop:1592 length:537 start_codon:yes stop_codon:yes gene_type:complete
MEAVERYLNSFGKQVVNRSKGNLQKAKGGGTNLENSISFKVIKTSTGFSLQFFMDSYGKFLDKGVSGNKIKRNYKDYKSKVISSPYKYTTKQPPPGILAKWIKKKGIKGRDKKSGRFISNMSLAFVIGRSIKRDGIKSLSFFQKPLGLGIKQFAPQMLESIKEDITNKLIASGKWQQQ